MAANEYHFITHWYVPGTRQEVIEILSEPEDLPRWWPAVYLGVNVLEPGDERGVGKVVDLYTKGWLPYTLRWRFRVTEVNAPKTLTIEADGDFVGRGVWTLAADDDHVHVLYDWRIRAEKPLLRRLSWLLKPTFAANHHWAMAKGEESLKLELARRHAATATDLARVPAPPQPTTAATSAVPLMAVSGAAVALALLLMRRRSSR